MGNGGVLVFLNFDRTAISGTVPASIGQLLYLRQLQLFGAQLTGTLPATIGDLHSIASHRIA